MMQYFERTLLDYPWVDPDIPSLVYEASGGEILAFLGSHVRRLSFDRRPIRMACGGQLVASPEARKMGVGALLVRQYLKGPQELTITDGATPLVRLIWTGLGGQVLAHASIGWTRVFRPGAAALALLSSRGHPSLSRVLGYAAAPFDAAARGLARGAWDLRPAEPDTEAELLTADGLLQQLPLGARSLRLHVNYDTEYLEWLFAELEAVKVRGALVRQLVRDRCGGVAGWYIYYNVPGGMAQVLQVVCLKRDSGDDVFKHLFWDAACRGAVAVSGRLEPSLLGILDNRQYLLYRTGWALVHSNNPQILSLLASPNALLTRLDGEWWMGHHVLWRDP